MACLKQCPLDCAWDDLIPHIIAQPPYCLNMSKWFCGHHSYLGCHSTIFANFFGNFIHKLIIEGISAKSDICWSKRKFMSFYANV